MNTTGDQARQALHQVRLQGHGNNTGTLIPQPSTAGKLVLRVAGKRSVSAGRL